MDILRTRFELQRMRRGDLLNLALDQGMSKCLIGGRPCGLHLHYKGSSFCVSEIMGKGCQVERLDQPEQFGTEKEAIHCPLLFLHVVDAELSLPRKKAVEFRVYYRDPLTRSTVFLGKIVERRTKERGDNLRDLLVKATKQFSGYVEDPSRIFLLGQ